MSDSIKLAETLTSEETSGNPYLSALKRIAYLSLVLWTLALRKVVEIVLGIKFKKIHIDSRMVEPTKSDWAHQQRVVRTEFHLRWRPWLEGSRPLPPPSHISIEEREEYDSLAPLPVIPRVRRVRSTPHRLGVTYRPKYNGAARSLSFPQDNGRHEQTKQRMRAQQLTRQVSDWRRMSKSVDSTHPNLTHPSLSADRLSQELQLLQVRGSEEGRRRLVRMEKMDEEDSGDSGSHEEDSGDSGSPGSPGSSSEDEGLGSSPPLSPNKPTSPPRTLRSMKGCHSGTLSPPRPLNELQSSPTRSLNSLRERISGTLSPLRSLSLPGTYSPPRQVVQGSFNCNDGTISPPTSHSPNKISPPTSPSPPRIFNYKSVLNPLTLGSLSPTGKSSSQSSHRRVLKLRRVEGHGLGAQRQRK